jgi:hypothetical protein
MYLATSSFTVFAYGITLQTASMMNSKLKFRSPYPSPSHPDPTALPISFRFVWFRHPGYPDDSNVLFTFTASDDDGIHHETARLACAIIAGNKWDGFLCEDRDGHQPSIDGLDEILRASTYYFHLPDAIDRM